MDIHAATDEKQEQETLESRREVKVKLPVRQLIRLHGVKLVHGHTISDTVRQALDAWFAAEDAAHDADAAPTDTPDGTHAEGPATD